MIVDFKFSEIVVKRSNVEFVISKESACNFFITHNNTSVLMIKRDTQTSLKRLCQSFDIFGCNNFLLIVVLRKLVTRIFYGLNIVQCYMNIQVYN